MDPLDRYSAAVVRRLPAVGRAAQYGLHDVSGVVLADVVDHGDPDAEVAPGHVSLVVWVEARRGETWRQRAPEVTAAVQDGARHFAQHAVVVVREAGLWARMRSWWRWRVWQVQRWQYERRRDR